MMWWDNSGWAWFWMTMMMVVFWAIVVVAVFLVVRALHTGPPAGSTGSPSRSPEDILAERYARGEIDSDEYHARLDALRSHAPH